MKFSLAPQSRQRSTSSSRGGNDAATVGEDLGQSDVEIMLRCPAEQRLSPRRGSDEPRRVAWAHASWILLDRDGQCAEADQAVENIADAAGNAGSDVQDRA